jgi:hypothetical protein
MVNLGLQTLVIINKSCFHTKQISLKIFLNVLEYHCDQAAQTLFFKSGAQDVQCSIQFLELS